MKRILVASGVTVEELLEGLAEERANLFGELYGDEKP